MCTVLMLDIHMFKINTFITYNPNIFYKGTGFLLSSISGGN